MISQSKIYQGLLELYIVSVVSSSVDIAKGSYVSIRYGERKLKTLPASAAQIDASTRTAHFFQPFQIAIDDPKTPLLFKIEKMGKESAFASLNVSKITSRQTLDKVVALSVYPGGPENNSPAIGELTLALQLCDAPIYNASPTAKLERIRIVQDRPSYRPGSVMRGYISLSNYEPLELNSMHLDITGEALDAADDKYSTFMEVKSVVPVPWRSAEKGGTFFVPQGLRLIPFHFYLPEDLPPSLSFRPNHAGRFRYLLALTLNPAQSHADPIVVKSDFFIETRPDIGVSYEEAAKKQEPVFFESDVISIRGRVSSLIVLGHSYKFKLKITNMGDRFIDHVYFGVVYRLITALDPRTLAGKAAPASTNEIPGSICGMNIPLRLAPGESDTLDAIVSIPRSNMFTIPQSVSRHYFVKCALKIGAHNKFATIDDMVVMNWSSLDAPPPCKYEEKSLVFYPGTKATVVAAGGLKSDALASPLPTPSPHAEINVFESKRTKPSKKAKRKSDDDNDDNPVHARGQFSGSTSSLPMLDPALFLCRECGTPNVDSLFLDCSHSIMCYKCATETIHLKRCPACNKRIQQVIQIYRY